VLIPLRIDLARRASSSVDFMVEKRTRALLHVFRPLRKIQREYPRLHIATLMPPWKKKRPERRPFAGRELCSNEARKKSSR